MPNLPQEVEIKLSFVLILLHETYVFYLIIKLSISMHYFKRKMLLLCGD